MEIIATIILLVGGLLAGIINAIVGGGSLISVPLLITVGLPTPLAIGTNRFAMIFNTGVGAMEYHRKSKYGVKLASFLAVFASVGSSVGAYIVLQIDEQILKFIIAVLMLLMGSIILYKKKLGLKERSVNLTKNNYALIVFLSFLLGIYGGFYGAGISTMFTFVFIAFLGASFIKSAGITRFIVSISSMIAAIVYLISGNIEFISGIVLTISFILGASIGVKLAFKAGNKWIRRLLLFLIVISSAKLLFF